MDAQNEVLHSLKDGKAYNKFVEMINYQKGNLDLLRVSDNIVEIKSEKEGYINNIDALKIGEASMKLGSGRINKEDNILYGVGIELVKNIGDYVNVGDTIAKVYVGKTIDYNDVRSAFTIDKEKKEKEKLIYGIIK